MASFKSQILTQASGSVGGLTFGHNRGGLYMRARSIPVNPNTTRQAAVRAGLTQAVNNWNSVLTPAERAEWTTYAANTPVTSKLGDALTLSGQQMYIRTATVGAQLTTVGGFIYPIPTAAPAVFNLGDFTTPTVPTADVVTGVSANVEMADAWAQETDSYMLLFQGRPMNASRNYFRGPWRLIGWVVGDSITPPTVITVSAANVAIRGYPLIAGQLTNLVVSVLRADGRLSTRRSLGNILITP